MSHKKGFTPPEDPDTDPYYPEMVFDDGYDEEPEDIMCPEGYTFEDWCSPMARMGIESCEFQCPWKLMDDVNQWYKHKTRNIIKYWIKRTFRIRPDINDWLTDEYYELERREAEIQAMLKRQNRVKGAKTTK